MTQDQTGTPSQAELIALRRQAQRLACDCQSPDFHQTGRYACMVSRLSAALLSRLESEGIASSPAFDLLSHLQRQRDWSGRTFGPGPRTAGVIDHIRKELREIEAEPADASEWIDVVILALDGAWRAGHLPEQIIAALVAKQAKNEARTWPDWRTMPTDKAIEHDRSEDAASSPLPPPPVTKDDEN